jgi:hypothetical protein
MVSPWEAPFGLMMACAGLAAATEIKTYFLNKGFDVGSGDQLIFEEPVMECLQAEGEFLFGEETTFCYRSRPMSYTNPRVPVSSMVGYGTKHKNDSEFREGFLFGVYDTGPWLGIKAPDSETYAWMGGGLHSVGLPFQVGWYLVHLEL